MAEVIHFYAQVEKCLNLWVKRAEIPSFFFSVEAEHFQHSLAFNTLNCPPPHLPLPVPLVFRAARRS